MKTLKLSIFVAAFAVLAFVLVTCQSSSTRFINEFTRFVEQVEENHTMYSDNDGWGPIDEQLKGYVNQYKELNAQEPFTDEEKEQIGTLVGRYFKARVSDWGFFKVVSWVGDGWKFIEGVLEGFGIDVDICNFIKTLTGWDVCGALNFGTSGAPVGINESSINESPITE